MTSTSFPGRPALVEITVSWSDQYGECHECGWPAAFYLPQAYVRGDGPDEVPNPTNRRCAVCAANAACDGDEVRRIETYDEEVEGEYGRRRQEARSVADASIARAVEAGLSVGGETPIRVAGPVESVLAAFGPDLSEPWVAAMLQGERDRFARSAVVSVGLPRLRRLIVEGIVHPEARR